MEKEKRYPGIIPQVAIFFAISLVLTGLIALVSQRTQSNSSIRRETEDFADNVAAEVVLSVNEFPAHEWLLDYWYEHADELDIEYDVGYERGTETEKKAVLLVERNPGLQLRYADEAAVRRLSAEDQKLFAEVQYSWLITRINQIKKTYNVAFLFCVITDETYQDQFFLFSAADEGAVRGTNYEEVYPIGTTVTVAGTQRNAMRNAVNRRSYLAAAGKYMDYYAYMCDVDGKPALIGLTYDLSALTASISHEANRATAFAILYQVILAGLLLGLIYRFVLKPLRKIQHNIRRYKDDKDSAAVAEELASVHPHNEIGQLSRDVTDLAVEMDEHVKNIAAITADRERLGTELSLANRIQEAMLPHTYPAFPDRKEFDIFASMDPAKEVGGDFYDYYMVDPDHLCLVIADVSGKGVPAALFMMASKIILSNNAMMGKSPAQILTDTNNMICSNNPEEMFVTVWLGMLEISTGKLTAVNAGHEYPVLRHPDGRFELVQDKHGLVVGAMEGIKYKEYELQLEPGSKIFLYTDGVPEATDADNNMLGTDKMLEALNLNGHADPIEVLKNVRDAVDGFVNGAEQFDDLTMMCLEFNGSSQTTHHELEVDALPENLPRVMEFVETKLEVAGCPMKTITVIDLAVEEIFVNIAKYAYAPETGKARIALDINMSTGEAVITFADRGTPYNPLEKEDPNVHLSADERPIGGLGIYLVKETMDSVTYVREDDCNILTIKKSF